MGMITSTLGSILGTAKGAQAIRDIAEVFRPNAEAVDQRDLEYRRAALEQLGTEFGAKSGGRWAQLVDGLNRLPRPFLALGSLALILSSMIAPEWFAARMVGLELVPEPLWWLIGAVVAFYFGGRHQIKSQEFQKSIAGTIARVPAVAASIESLRGLNKTAESPGAAKIGDDPETEARIHKALATGTMPEPPAPMASLAANPALEEWRRRAKG